MTPDRIDDKVGERLQEQVPRDRVGV
jgi:hypothetical protein